MSEWRTLFCHRVDKSRWKNVLTTIKYTLRVYIYGDLELSNWIELLLAKSLLIPSSCTATRWTNIAKPQTNQNRFSQKKISETKSNSFSHDFEYEIFDWLILVWIWIIWKKRKDNELNACTRFLQAIRCPLISSTAAQTHAHNDMSIMNSFAR